MLGVEKIYGIRIEEHFLCFFKRNAMILEILFCFLLVPTEFHFWQYISIYTPRACICS